MSRILPALIQNNDIELCREEIIAFLPSPSRTNCCLKFSYSLYRRRDHTFLGTVHGQLEADINRISSVECRMADSYQHIHSYMSKAVCALESHVTRHSGSEPDVHLDKYEDYEIYL